MFDRPAAEAWLDAVLGQDEGYLVGAFGVGGAVINGKYTFEHAGGRWDQFNYAWPAQRDAFLDDVDRESLTNSALDVYVTPYIMRTPKRAKGNAVVHRVVHVDRDGNTPVDRHLVMRAGGFVVESGTHGHEHAYVVLQDDAGDRHETLCRALGRFLGDADHKISDNDLLRLPGTRNFKHDPPRPVRWLIEPRPIRPTVETLARTLGLDLGAPVQPVLAGRAGAPETVDMNRLPTPVLTALSELSGDRSTDTMRVVGACYTAGLTLGQTRSVVSSREDLRDRLGDRKDDDVLTCWQKVDDDRRRSGRIAQPDAAPAEPDAQDETGWLTGTPRPLVARPMSPVPEFPVEVLPDALARHVRAVAEASLTPVDFAAVACLGAISAACAGHARVRVNRTYEQPVNLYFVPVAGPGEGKTPAFAPFESVLFDWQTQCREAGREERARAQATHEAASERVEAARTAIRQALKASGKPKLRVVGSVVPADAAEADVDELQHQLGEALLRAEEAPAPVTPTVVITGNATPEALLRVLADNGGRLAIMATEGRIVDIVSGAYSTKADVTPLLMAYDGSLIDGHRIGRDVPDVEDPALTICVAVQPVVWVEAMRNRQLRDRGLIPRVLACYPKPMIGRRDRPLTEVAEAVETAALNRLTHLLQEAARHSNSVLRLSGPAYAAFEEYRRDLDRRSPEGRDLYRLAAWTAKHAARAVRLAALLHLADDPEGGWVTSVTAEDFARARAIADYYVAHQLALLDAAEEDESTGDDSAPAYLLRYLKRRDPKPDGWSLRDLSRAASKSRFPGGESDLRGALEVLADYGWVLLRTPEKQRPGGRPPSLRVITHPAMHADSKRSPSTAADIADVADNGPSPAKTTSASTSDIAPVGADIAPSAATNVGNVGNPVDHADIHFPWSEANVGNVGKVGSPTAPSSAPTSAGPGAVTNGDAACDCPNGRWDVHRPGCAAEAPATTGRR